MEIPKSKIMRESDEHEEMTAVEVSPDSLYQQDKATVDMQIATAHQFPRSIKRATDNALAIVSMDKETAATCTYSVPRGGKSITGPSVNLAKILVQQWGNMRVQAKVVSVEDRQITSQAIAWDLESNVAIQIEVKRSIMSKNGRFSDDMIVVTGNAANSIALRNAILSVIPKAVVTKVYKAAVETITGDISDENKLKAARRKLVEALTGAYKVKEDEVLAAVGRVNIDHLTAEDIVVLTGIGTAIKDGDTTVAEAFKSRPVTKTAADKEKDRILKLIGDATSPDELLKHEKHAAKDPVLQAAFNEKMAELKAVK